MLRGKKGENMDKLTENLDFISTLPDQPTTSAAELKREFDKAGNIIKDYINNILITQVDAELKKINAKVDSEVKNKFESIYHIGKVIISTNSNNPRNYLGFGTWQLIGQGRTLVGVDSNNAEYSYVKKAGGSRNISIQKGNLPNYNLTVTDNGHTHTQAAHSHEGYKGSGVAGNNLQASGTTGTLEPKNTSWVTPTINNAKTGIVVNTGGSGTAITHTQPYYTVYIFERTA